MRSLCSDMLKTVHPYFSYDSILTMFNDCTIKIYAKPASNSLTDGYMYLKQPFNMALITITQTLSFLCIFNYSIQLLN